MGAERIVQETPDHPVDAAWLSEYCRAAGIDPVQLEALIENDPDPVAPYRTRSAGGRDYWDALYPVWYLDLARDGMEYVEACAVCLDPVDYCPGGHDRRADDLDA